MMPPLLALLLLCAPESSTVAPRPRLSPGSVAWLDVQVRLERRPRRPEVRLLAIGGDGPAELLPHPILAGVDGRTARVRVPLRVRAGAPSGVLATARGTVVVTEAGGERALGRRRVEHRVRVGPPKPPAADLAGLRRRFAAWRARLDPPRAAPGALLLEPPPDRPRSSPPDPVVEVELQAALEAMRVRARLEGSAAALEAVAEAESTLPLDAERMPFSTVASSLRHAARALAALRFREARAELDAQRRTGVARPPELAVLLLLKGLVDAAAGRRSAADAALGQALCLDPEVAPPPLPPYFLRRVAAARRASRCETGLSLAIGELAWFRDEGRAGVRLPLEAHPDPFRLVDRVEAERFGAGGAPAETWVMEVGEREALAARFFGLPDPPPEQILVRVTAFDRYGHVLAREGDPDPVRRALPRVESDGLPAWVWWAGGAVLVVGAAVAGGVALDQGGGVTRGIGPVRVDF